MLIKKSILDQIKTGTIQLIFRKWKRPTVKSGGTLKTRIGELDIEEVLRTDAANIKEGDANLAGYESLQALLDELENRKGDLYRIRVSYKGEDPRIALRSKDQLSEAELRAIQSKLEKYDRNSRQGPWTLQTLKIIQSKPATLAATLATELGFEKAWFKPQVRKLKALGLTESLEVGYRLSPRGMAVLTRINQEIGETE